MARRQAEEDEGSMDSLLDTMMNVVGILIIVLVVTQLGVGDAVKRIGESIAVDPKMLEEAKKKLAALELQRDRLQATALAIEPVDAEDYDQRHAEVREQISQRQKQLDQLLVQQKLEEDQLASAKKRAVAVTKQIEEDTAARETLQKEITTSQEAEASLKAMLAESSPRGQMPPLQITLPNPRPAPPGASQFPFICNQNQMYPLNLEGFRKTAGEIGLSVIRSERLQLHLPVTKDQKILHVMDKERFIREFNKRPLRDKYFEVEMVDGGAYPRLVFHPFEGRGEDEKSLTGVRSRIRQALSAIDRTKYFIRFYVCSDSFDIYVTGRRLITELGLQAGWEPQNAEWNYAASMGGSIRLGPPPKPQPKPKTPLGVQPKPKPKPADVIDGAL